MKHWHKLRQSFSTSDHRLTDLLIALAAFMALYAMSLIVAAPQVPPWEITGFRVINNLPDWLFPILWPFMQYGVFVTIPFVAVLALYFKRVRLAILLLLGGIGIYYLARYIKEVIPRGRPADILGFIQARESTAPGSTGFTSGHTAVASTIATFAHYYLTNKWRIISIVTLCVVVIGRVYVGAHLPLDVFGGVALGVGVASFINFVVGVPRREPKQREDTDEWLAAHRPRHPGDIIRLFLAAVVFFVATLLAFGQQLSLFEEAVFNVINLLPGFVSPVLELIMQAGAYFFVFVSAGIALLLKHRRLALKMVFGGTVVWVLAKVAKELVNRERPFYLIAEIVDRVGNATGLGFPSGHAAVAALLATVTSPYIPKPWRRVVWTVAWIVALSRVYVGVHLPLDIIAGLAMGWFFGSLLNLAFGTPAKKLPIASIKAKLTGTKFELATLKRPALDARGSTPLFGRTSAKINVFIKLFDSEHRNADLLYRLWRFVSLRQVEDEAPFATAKQIAEHEAFVAMQAKQAGVNTPQILTVSSMSDHSAMIVSHRIDGVVLTEYDKKITSGLLQGIWREVAQLHENQIAHRDLRSANIMVDKDGKPWLIDFSFSATSATERQLLLDITELLVSTSLLTTPERAINAAIKVMGKQRIKQVLPYLQPLSLSTSTQRKLRNQDQPSLRAIAAALRRLTGARPVRKAQMRRLNYKWLWVVVVVGLATYYLLPQLGELNTSLQTIRHADPLWLLLGVLASSATYLMAAVAVVGSTSRRLPYGLTLIFTLATTIANRITPKGVGGVALTEQYLEKSGLSRSKATVSTTFIYSAGVIMHIVLLIITVSLVGFKDISILSINSSQLVIVLIMLAILGLITIALPRIRSMMRRWYNEFAKGIRSGINQPIKIIQLTLGSAGVTLSYAVALYCSLEAFGSVATFGTVALIYLAANVIASAAPTPGGLGALEAALVVGFGAAGVSIDQAVAGVLAFRLITFWLPLIPGFWALRYINDNVFSSH